MVLSRIVEPPDLLVVTLAGVVTAGDQITVVDWVRGVVREAGAVRVLVMLEWHFGWRLDERFEDAALWLRDDDEVTKIAIVGDSSWRADVLGVIGWPLRRIPIEYFDCETTARRWLSADPAAAAGVV